MKEQGRMHQAHVHAVHRAKAFTFKRWMQHFRIQLAHRAIVVTNLHRVTKRYSIAQQLLAFLHWVLTAICLLDLECILLLGYSSDWKLTFGHEWAEAIKSQQQRFMQC